MNPLKSFNDAMKYIEDNLYSEIDYKEIEKRALCSEYHFRRMFSFLSGMTLSEYIRKRRLSDCISSLKDKRIIDVALDCSYNSADAFTRSFQNLHGITPSEARKGSIPVKAFPPLTFHLKIEGGTIMEYRIEEKQKFYIAGYKKRITLQYTGVNHQMDSLNEKLTPDVIKELKSISNEEPKGIVQVSCNFAEERTEGSQLDQYVGVATNSENIPEKYDVLEVNHPTWAVFTSVGKFPDELQNTWAKIYSQWLPTSGYELTGGPEILWNESPDTSKADYRSEIWIPVISK